jgi:hypothetical protein
MEGVGRSEEHPDATHMVINVDAYEYLQQTSRGTYEKEIGELELGEVSMLIGAMIVSLSESGNARVRSQNRTVVDAVADGQEALRSYSRKAAENLVGHIEDNGELILNVIRNKTRWDSILRRGPRIEHTLYYR